MQEDLSQKNNKPTQDQVIDIPIHALGSHGEGVGYFHGYTVFVDGALPDEIAKVKISTAKKNYAIADLLKIEKPSHFRVTPSCPLFGTCGGCQIMHLAYEKQLSLKTQKVRDALQRIGKIDPSLVFDCQASPTPLHYRNKIQLPVNEHLHLGLYKKGSHELVEVDQCLIHCDLGELVFSSLQKILKKSTIKPYDPKTQTGNLRHVLIKTAQRTNQVLIVLITKDNQTEELQKIADNIMQLCPEVKGVIQNIHAGPDNVILGRQYHVLKGEEKIIEILCDLKFSISAASFFQVNPNQAENLYKKALELANISKTDTVLDAYCGVGTLSLIFAKAAKKVIGVECVKAAILDAKENAKRNNISNVVFECAASETFIHHLKNIDVVILNPPRKGCDPSFLKGIQKLQPSTLIYISCDPATLARDLKLLNDYGYKTLEVHPFDMFPQTSHVENVVKLSKVF